MGRLCALALAACAVLSPAAVAAGSLPRDQRAAVPQPSWAAAQIATVTAAAALGDPAAFRADDPILAGELHDALVRLGRTATAPIDASRPVSIRELDARLVTALGLRPAAARIRVAALGAGLRPTPYLGTETVARLLGLRINHPQSREALERRPKDVASRAEAAHSLARLLAVTPQHVAAVDGFTQSFAFAELSDVQRSVLTRALRFVGYPYVFAGASEKPQRIWSGAVPGGFVDAPAGFDCSGLLWRVFKLEPFVEAPQLASVLVGRSTYVMSAEVPPARRIPFEALAPGDVVFFGDRGTRSVPAQVGHAGIYVGSGWFVHAASQGVTLQPLEGWYRERFAWGRRPLAEAGLSV